MEVKAGYVVAFNHLKDATWFDVLAVDGFIITIREQGTNYAPQHCDRATVARIRFPVTEQPNPSPQNAHRSYNVRWITKKGTKSGNSAPTLDRAQAMANRVAKNDATDIRIESYWFAGCVF